MIPALIARWQAKLPAQLRDRCAIHVDVPRLNYERLSSQRLAEFSAAVRAHIALAWQRQAQQKGMKNSERRLFNALTKTMMLEGSAMLVAVPVGMHLSLFTILHSLFFRGAAQIGPAHVAEALQSFTIPATTAWG